jgi:LEA14-like dessication related protein
MNRKKSSKKRRYLVYGLLIVIVLFIGAASVFYFSFKKPVVSNFKLDIGSYPSNDTLAMTVGLKVFNPNAIGVSFDSVEYKILIDGELNGFGAIHHREEVKANSYETISLPLKYFFSKGVKEDIKKDIDYGLFSFQFHIYTHIGKFNFPFDYTITKKLPLFKTLYFNIDSLEIKHLGLKKSNVTAFITLSNPNQLRFRSTHIGYEVYVGGEDFAKGENKVDVLLKPKGTLALALPMEIKSGLFIKDLILFKKHNQNKTYKVVCRINLKTDSKKSPETIKLRVERYGLLKEIQGGMKSGLKSGKKKAKVKF